MSFQNICLSLQFNLRHNHLDEQQDLSGQRNQSRKEEAHLSAPTMDSSHLQSRNSSTLEFSHRATAAQHLVTLLTPLLTEKPQPLLAEGVQGRPSINNYRDILSAIRSLTSNLVPDSPVFSAFHDGRVHDPLGAGSYAFHNDLVEPILQALQHDEILTGKGELHENDQSGESPIRRSPAGRNCGPDHVPTRPILIHVGAQPNNSPHVGTLVVFCHAFSVARAIQRRTQRTAEHTGLSPR